jgi:hypothetical protein
MYVNHPYNPSLPPHAQLMRQVSELVVAQFVSLLLADYARWLDGTRDASIGVGELVPGAEREGTAAEGARR